MLISAYLEGRSRLDRFAKHRRSLYRSTSLADAVGEGNLKKIIRERLAQKTPTIGPRVKSRI